jgi:hypothetical protein
MITDYLCKIGLHKIERQYVKIQLPKGRLGQWHKALFGDEMASHDECVRCNQRFEIPRSMGEEDMSF